MISLGNNFKFNINDIPEDEWNKRARKEAEEIKSNPKDKHRDLESDIYPNTRRGHGAEWFSMLNLEHTDNPKKYQDTYDTDDIRAEHKVSLSRKYLDMTIENYEKLLLDDSTDWHIKRAKNMAKRVYGWINPYDDYEARTYTNEYTLVGIWEFDKKLKKLVYISPKVWYNRYIK
jgi:hypothetical protein